MQCLTIADLSLCSRYTQYARRSRYQLPDALRRVQRYIAAQRWSSATVVQRLREYISTTDLPYRVAAAWAGARANVTSNDSRCCALVNSSTIFCFLFSDPQHTIQVPTGTVPSSAIHYRSRMSHVEPRHQRPPFRSATRRSRPSTIAELLSKATTPRQLKYSSLEASSALASARFTCVEPHLGGRFVDPLVILSFPFSD